MCCYTSHATLIITLTITLTLTLIPNEDFTVKCVLAPILLSSSFVCSPKRLCSNRLTRTLDRSLLQGHILPLRGPRHPRPAPLVSQVVLSSYVIDRGESFGVLDIIGDSFFVFTSSLPPFLASFLLPFYFLRNSFPFRNRSYTSHRALSLSVSLPLLPLCSLSENSSCFGSLSSK